jgi:peptidoglycan/xylan/chitin deacetylase (PgdA/CDA1 family)
MRAILTWHSVDASGSPISVTPDEFRRQVAWLVSGRVRVVSVGRLLDLPNESNAVALTFDDGFVNFATEAAPILREHALPVTLFVVTGRAGADNRWRGRGDPGIPALPLLDWDQLGRLHESGVSLGAHSVHHRRLTRLARDEVEAELAQSAAELERRVGERPEGFAYPYGAADETVRGIAGRHYRWACTTDLRPLPAGAPPLGLPRLDAWYLRDPARLAHWGTPRFRTWLWYRRQGRRLRRGLVARTA